MKQSSLIKAVLLGMIVLGGATRVTAETKSTVAVTTPKQDKSINDKITTQIANSKTLATLPVSVTTDKGEVTIVGDVESDSQAEGLIQIAQSVKGVQEVNAKGINVKESTQPFTDMLTTAKIKGLFIREDVFGTQDISSLNISVETKNGIVYLTGVVDNKQQIKNAIKLIEGVKGVKKVEYRVDKSAPAAS